MPGCLCWPCDQSLYWPHVWHLEALLDAHGKAPLWWPAKINEELGYSDTVVPCPLWKVDPLKVKVVILVSEHQVPCMVQRFELEYGVKLSSAGKLAEAEKQVKQVNKAHPQIWSQKWKTREKSSLEHLQHEEKAGLSVTRPTTGRSKWILFALLPNFIHSPTVPGQLVRQE